MESIFMYEASKIYWQSQKFKMIITVYRTWDKDDDGIKHRLECFCLG